MTRKSVAPPHRAAKRRSFVSYSDSEKLNLRLVGNIQLLPDLNLVRVFQFVAIRVEDLHVLVGVAVELFADLRERVAGFDGVSLRVLAAAARRRSLCAAGINVDVRRDVVLIRVDEFD